MDRIIPSPRWCQEEGTLTQLAECLGVQQSPVGAEVVPLGWGELGGSVDMLPLESERNVHQDSFQEYEEAYAVPVGVTPVLRRRVWSRRAAECELLEADS